MFRKLFQRLTGKTKVRNYDAAQTGRLFSDWIAGNTSGDAEIRNSIKLLRARSRELERNDDYARKFFGVLVNNVLGSDGINMQMKVTEPSGLPDRMANEKLEEAWHKWGQPKHCTVTGDMSWLDVQKMALRSVARDGGFLIRKIRTSMNPFGFALQLMEIDYLNTDHNSAQSDNGPVVKMGIEKDNWGRVLAYWLFPTHPGDMWGGESFGRELRVPADDIIHLYAPERMGQTIGVPWLISSITRLRMLGGYEEAELVAARVASCKGGFYIKPGGQQYSGETDPATGQMTTSMEPGAFETLPEGWDFKPNDPQHPTTNYGAYVKACLRGIASGLGISYGTLSGDMSDANFSSMRAGLLDEREQWKMLQAWVVTHLCQSIFTPWLESSLMTGAIELPLAKLDKFNRPCWRGRRWQWVDPQSDVTASLAAINGGLTSRSKVISENGSDLEDVFDELAEEKRLADADGLVFLSPNLGGSLPGAIPPKQTPVAPEPKE